MESQKKLSVLSFVLAVFTTNLLITDTSTAATCKSPLVAISKTTQATYTNVSSWSGSLSIAMNVVVNACSGVKNSRSSVLSGSISVTPVIGASTNNPLESIKTSATNPRTRSTFSDCVIAQGGLFISPSVVAAARNADPKQIMSCMVFTSTTTARVDISTKAVTLPKVKVKIGEGQKASYPYALIVTTIVAPNGEILSTVQ